jgi:hypothetical protein
MASFQDSCRPTNLVFTKMGNVLDVAKGAGDTYTEDLKWLGIQNSAIFNDAYVSEIYQSLPVFEGTEIVEVNVFHSIRFPHSKCL